MSDLCYRCLMNGIHLQASQVIEGLPVCRYHDPLIADLVPIKVKASYYLYGAVKRSALNNDHAVD